MATENGHSSSSFYGKNRENGKRVCGLILVDERISLKNNYSSRDPEYKNFITLGSVVIEKDSCTCEELRKLIADQLRLSVPKNFSFLSREGWPLLKTQEAKLKTTNVINESNVIAVRKLFEKPRIGVVSNSGDSLGFIFADYSSNLKMVRQLIDELLREIMSKPMKIEYKFVERNGWPVSQNQELTLTVFDILVNLNVCIKVKIVSETMTDGRVLEAHQPLALPAPESSMYSKQTMLQGEIEDTWRKTLKRSITKRQTTRRFKIKAPKPKYIMISYARQEAAQHALILKKELLSFGFTVYVDVDEIRTGTDWQDALNEAVSYCHVFVPLVTPLYGKTQWTNREVKLADILHKTIIPINFLDQWPPECLAIQFATTQYIPWRPVNCENESLTDKNYDIKIWMEKYVKRVAKLIAEQTRWKPEPEVIPVPPEIPKQILDKKSSIVISAHPHQKSIVNDIKQSLGTNFDIWCTIDEFNEFGSSESLTNICNLPTIPEGSESGLSENYKAIARQIALSKRPISLPPTDVSSESRKLCRMVSQISTISQISSLTPDKMEKLKQFEAKVSEAKVVIVLASEAYFRSRTSRQHVYYCEHRKNMILVRCDQSSLPSWFTMLMADELPITISDPNYLQSIKSRIKRLMDPSSKANDREMQESKVAYLVNYMKKNLPVLDTCVYIIGSSEVLDTRVEEICKAIGVELSRLKNVTLVTNGFNGASDIVARAFFEAKERQEVEIEGRRNSEIRSSVVHILPLKDSQVTQKCRQNPDGSFEPLAYGQTLFLGESLKEREKAVARLLNTCILIKGGAEDANEAQEFIWNDHYVIPVISTGGAASGQFGVPFKIFESPLGVTEDDRRNLSNKEASPEQVAKSVVKIVVTVKKCIASYKTQVNNSNKSAKKKSSKKKKPQEKLDVASANAVAAQSTVSDNSPDKVLPVVDIDLNTGRTVKHSGKWKRVQKLITFSRHN